VRSARNRFSFGASKGERFAVRAFYLRRKSS
jgi:hypothetical protein